MTTFTVDEARRLVVDALMRSKTGRQNAEAVARALIAAELVGQKGHGLRRVVAYSAQAAAGKVDGFATPEALRVKPGSLAVDAAYGFAYPALELAVAQLPDMARGLGIAMAGIRRSHHCGVAGVTVEALADQGLVAMLFANAPAAMAPWGGKRPLFGTDPIAFAAPLPDEEPIVVDISLSKVARGKIMAAEQTGEPIPEGWALDSGGNPTTDPAAAMAGTMVPLGDAKGTTLALMVELLCAGLTGANYAYEATSFFNAEGEPPGVGQTIIAIDPAAFGRPGTLERFAEMARAVAGTDGARLPGRRRQEIRARLGREGISVDAQLVAAIEAVGA